MEKIKIQNFAGIKAMEFEFNSINILIGPQGSGKSVTVKLHYFFRDFFKELRKNVEEEESEQELDNVQKEKFIKFFPKDTWSEGDFDITYFANDIWISLKQVTNQIKLDYSENLKEAIRRIKLRYSEEKIENNELDIHRVSREIDLRGGVSGLIKEEIGNSPIHNQFFIPAGRSFFANIQKSIFSFLNDNRFLDPFLIEFGATYEVMKGLLVKSEGSVDKEFDKISAGILNGAYVRENNKDYLVHKDNRKVNLSNASSGQQETLPLILILKGLNSLRSSSHGEMATIYIEEPEAHLFPDAQKAIVQLLARVFNNKRNDFQVFVTTHSPYILSSFNNLLEAGRLSELKPETAKDIAKIVPVAEQLKPGLLTAYSLSNGKKEDLIDKETNLITQTILDNISNDIAIEFGKLLDIEF